MGTICPVQPRGISGPGNSLGSLFHVRYLETALKNVLRWRRAPDIFQTQATKRLQVSICRW